MAASFKHPSNLGPKIRLGILTQFYPPDYAATGQLIEELAQNLGKQGLEVRIFTGQPGYAFSTAEAPVEETQQQVRIRRSQTSRLWPHRIRGRAINGLLFTLRSALRILNPWHRVDILLITTEPPYLNLLGFLASRLLGIPYICLMYDLYPDVAVALQVLSPRHGLVRLWAFLNRQIWQEAQALIVLSSTMRDRIIAHCPQVEPKIAIIHSWSDPTFIQPRAKTQNWFAQHHHLDRKFTVLYSGNMGRCHDIQTLLETVKQLRHEPIQFVFIGSGAKYPPLRAAVEAASLTNCIFLPYQDKQVLPYSLTACDVALVSIEKGMEGLVVPSKLYGSLAAGRPIAAVCEEHSYLREILHNARCGQAFQNQDSLGLAQFLRYLSQHPHYAAEMGHNGSQYLQNYFTPQQIAQLYGEVIHQCILAKNLVEKPNFSQIIPQPGVLPSHLLGWSSSTVRSPLQSPAHLPHRAPLPDNLATHRHPNPQASPDRPGHSIPSSLTPNPPKPTATKPQPSPPVPLAAPTSPLAPPSPRNGDRPSPKAISPDTSHSSPAAPPTS